MRYVEKAELLEYFGADFLRSIGASIQQLAVDSWYEDLECPQLPDTLNIVLTGEDGRSCRFKIGVQDDIDGDLPYTFYANGAVHLVPIESVKFFVKGGVRVL